MVGWLLAWPDDEQREPERKSKSEKYEMRIASWVWWNRIRSQLGTARIESTLK